MNGLTAHIEIDGTWVRVDLAEVGLEGDRRRWRVDAPGRPHDGWLVGDQDLRVMVEHPAVQARRFTVLAGPTAVGRGEIRSASSEGSWAVVRGRVLAGKRQGEGSE